MVLPAKVVFSLQRDLPARSQWIDVGEDDLWPGDILRLCETGEVVMALVKSKIGTWRVRRGFGSLRPTNAHAGHLVLLVSRAYPEMPWYAD